MRIALLGHFTKIISTLETYSWILKLAGSGFKSIQRKILKFFFKSESGSNLNFGSRGKISYISLHVHVSHKTINLITKCDINSEFM